ncbi:MAG: CARDB domain-containing protein, partial [Candidatus Thermoplasmatota archaeon]|nr:CARDB domain-containing protein [Candidatus Thermoplasmatota archaeon]MEE3277237.1 CARDB domain-containing protein [Candidatus Thermoplasmatota archaeon]
HELTSYQPAGRYKQISVEVAHPLSPVDFEMSAWVNATSSSGTGGANMPLAGQGLEFRYEIGGDVQNVTTASNGSAFVTFDTGHLADDTESETDLGSHGVVAWITGEKVLGAATVTIDPDVHQVDLVARSEGVTVERTRGNRTVTLDSNIGFNAIFGDQLIFSVPVLNRGIIDSPGTTLMIEAPDGSTSSTSVPSLSSLEESRVNVSWTVLENHPYGDISLSFVVDPDEQITSDGNRSNNEGSFSLFIGSMPTVSLAIVSEELTLAEVTFNGLSSYDPDGGVVTCEFSVEELDGGTSTSSEEDCIHEYTWGDDGTFLVTVTITDDENDQAYAEAPITILNRPPDVAIGSNLDSVPVLSPVTFDVIESGDLDTQNPDAPVDIQWHSPCEEGQVGVRCTITPDAEGAYTIVVTAMDDDGATTEASLTLDVTNIAPTNPQNEVWIGPNRLIPDSVGRYFVNEGDVLILRGWADDSENDLDGHQHHWSPDAELDPDLVISSVGHYSTIEHTYQISGQHLATLQIVDDDGASTETLIVPITVNNVVPSIAPLATLLPVAEDQLVQLSVEVTDTMGDLPNLIHCFDLDPYTDSDSECNESDDCDVESRHLAHAWADATTAPDYIVFHVTDDDGARDYIAILLDVNNLDPVARATTSDDKPTEGDVIFLSANGTTDSEYDMENMIYIWDLDIHEDSDGDGDPANDHDRSGMWVEVSFDGEGTRTVQMTAFDEGHGSSVTLVIQVQKAPFSLGGLVSAYGIYIGLLGLIAILGVLLMQRLRPPEIVIEAPVFEDRSRRKGKRISMDDAFDDPEYDPFDTEKGESGPKKSGRGVGPIIPEPMEPKDPQKMEADIAHAFEELTGEAPHQDELGEEESESAPASLDEALDDEDIEALFDD